MPFLFNGYALDVERGELRLGDEAVHLQPKHLQLLVFLIQNRDRVLSKQEIFDAVWANVAVSEAAMSSAIRDLRIALGDRGPDKWAIRTLPRRGFRFVAHVVETAPAKPNAPDSPLQLYGRERALGQLQAAHRRAQSGKPQLVLLLGDPGMGKTACSAAAAESFGRTGTSVHRAWCRTESGAPAYWPWIQWLRSIQRRAAFEEADESKETLSAWIQELWSAGTEPASAQPDVERAEARFRLFDAVSTEIESLAEQESLALFVDDLDAASDASLDLIEFAVRQLPRSRLLFVASLRTGALHARSSLVVRLEEWMRHIECSRVFLAPLSPADVSAWFAGAGVDPQLEDAREVATRAGGNPQWIRQWVAAVHASRNAAKPREVPRVVLDLAAARLSQVSSEARRVLRAAACLGTFARSELCAVARCEDEEVERALFRARESGVVSETAGAEPRVAFASPLYSELLVREASAAELGRARQTSPRIPQDSPAGAPVRLAPG